MNIKEWFDQVDLRAARRSEDYYDKLHRIGNSPDSRLFSTDHHGRHCTFYNLVSETKMGWHRVEVRTICEMEIVRLGK